MGHRPGPGRPVPVSTYRLQVTAESGFDDVAAIAGYLFDLGVTHAYVSPILSSGGSHGYDVTSHGDLNADKGGREAFDAMVSALHTAGVRLVVDVVPNHMTVSTPMSRNAQFWSVLREGRRSPHAHWFDIDWDADFDQLVLPVLGSPLASVLARGQLGRGVGGPDGTEAVLTYHDHEFPIAPGTEGLELEDLLAAQPYRLAHWRDGEDELNYRRFFDVTSLAAIRVEEPDVFYRTHAILLDLVDSGAIDGLRIDHPDGLADPGGYLRTLAESTGGIYVVVEKILEGHEQLPDDWACCGTTGYDSLNLVGRLFVDPLGEGAMTAALADLTGESAAFDDVAISAKDIVVKGALGAEVNRLSRLVGWLLPRSDPAAHARALEALLVGMDRYRAYVTPGGVADDGARAVLRRAADRARARLDLTDHGALEDVVQLACGDEPAGLRPEAEKGRADFVVRFQQTCGPVMAKGVEDTAFYRYPRLLALNEVGGDPGHWSVGIEAFHAYAAARLDHWPLTMTTSSTHDTKRSEDVRARLAVMSERPAAWAAFVTAARDASRTLRPDSLDPATEFAVWQQLVGAWPIDGERLSQATLKYVREAKQATSWQRPDTAYEDAVASFAVQAVQQVEVARLVERWLEEHEPLIRANVLGQKLIQLTMPGVADTYQGTELIDLSLVDPDNRRPVDYVTRKRLLADVLGGRRPRSLDEEKLMVTAQALRCRRAHPEWFVGDHATYEALPAGDHVVAFGRGDGTGIFVVTVVTRLAGRLEDAGWGATTLSLPPGTWTDAFTGRALVADTMPTLVSEILRDLPVSLLVSDRASAT